MKFGKKEAILTAVVVALCGLVVFLGLRRSRTDQNFPEGTWWICTNKDCKHEFNLSIQAVSDHHKAHYGAPSTELMTFDLDFAGWLMGPPARLSAAGSGEVTALLGWADGRSATIAASGLMPAGNGTVRSSPPVLATAQTPVSEVTKTWSPTRVKRNWPAVPMELSLSGSVAICWSPPPSRGERQTVKET